MSLEFKWNALEYLNDFFTEYSMSQDRAIKCHRKNKYCSQNKADKDGKNEGKLATSAIGWKYRNSGVYSPDVPNKFGPTEGAHASVLGSLHP